MLSSEVLISSISESRMAMLSRDAAMLLSDLLISFVSFSVVMNNFLLKACSFRALAGSEMNSIRSPHSEAFAKLQLPAWAMVRANFAHEVRKEAA